MVTSAELSIKKKKCSDCGDWKPLDEFYGRKRKQPRCKPCYNAAYGAYYRRVLKESKTGTPSSRGMFA